MPKRAPLFRPAGWKPREPWQRPDNWKDPRTRGRAGQRDRVAVLAEEPFCRLCQERGRHVRATIVDHIVPLEWSKCDERWNKQGICDPCHDQKSTAERVAGRPSDIEIAHRLAGLKADHSV